MAHEEKPEIEDTFNLEKYQLSVDTAKRAFAKLIGADLEACTRYADLCEEFHLGPLEVGAKVAKLFTGIELKKTRAVTTEVASYYRLVHELRSNEIAKLVLDREFTEDELRKALRGEGIDIADDTPFYENDAAYNLEKLTSRLYHQVDRLESETPLSHIDNFVIAVDAIAASDKKAAGYFLRDALDYVAKRVPLVNSMLHVQNFGHRIASGAFVWDDTKAPLEEFVAFAQSYISVEDAGLLDSATKFAEERSEGISAAHKGIELLTSQGIRPRDAGNVVKAVPENQRRELWELLLANPEYVKFAANAGKNGNMKYAAEFLLYYADVEVEIAGGKTNWLEFVQTVAEDKRNTETVKVILENSALLLLDEQARTLLENSLQNPNLHPLIKDYLKYRESGYEHKQKVTEKISMAGLSSVEIKRARKNL